MEPFYFLVSGYEPVMELCVDRDDACQRAFDVSLEISKALGRFVAVEVRDAEGQHVRTNTASKASLPDLLDVLVQSAIEYWQGGVRAALFLANAERNKLRHVTGMAQAFDRPEGLAIGPQSVACGLCAHVGQPIITPDVFKEPRWTPWLALPRQFEFRAVWSFPVTRSPGEVLGTFALYHKEPTEPTAREFDFATALARTAAAVIVSHGHHQRSSSADASNE
jgi:GAF domain-containing protein